MQSPTTLNLRELLTGAGRQLRRDFEELRLAIPHHGEAGLESEQLLKRFLKNHLPRRFDVESGIIVGVDGAVSRQCDLLIYDALDCPVYRRGDHFHILPRDNVAATVEVKSKLDKRELADAAAKIASAKRIAATPLTNVDQPVTLGDMIVTEMFGCVFAFDSYTSLASLAENLQELNSEYPSSEWIDMVIVLDQGTLGYSVQMLFESRIAGHYGGRTTTHTTVVPAFVHLVRSDSKDMALSELFFRLMSHLTFFRRRSAIDFASALGPEKGEATTVAGYQYNLSATLQPVEERHKAGSFKNPEIRFNLYSKKDGSLCGQACLLPWQDGHVITCSFRGDPNPVFRHFHDTMKLTGLLVQRSSEKHLWYSSVIPNSVEEFIAAANAVHADLLFRQDADDEGPPPRRIDL